MTRAILRRSAPALVLPLALAGTLAAQERPPPDTIRGDSIDYVVPEIIARVSGPIATIGGASAFHARMDSLALGPVPTLEQVLREVPLVQIRQNSRGEAHFALRGAGERQVAVLVDGIPITLGWDHRADLSVVPMMAANGVRLNRGLPSVLHGPNVLGGVVEVDVARSPAPIEDPQPFTASTAFDHVGSASVSASGGRRFRSGDEDVVLRVGAGHRTSPGDARSDRLSATPAGGARLRANSDVRQTDAFMSARYRGENDRWLSFTASGFLAERGVPPEEHEDGPRLWRYPELGRLLAAASGGTGDRETPWGRGDLEASVGVELGRTEVDQYESLDYRTVTGGETGTDRTFTLRLLGDHTLGERGDLRAAATFADIGHDEILRPDTDTRIDNEYRQRLWSLGGEVAWRLDRLPLAGDLVEHVRISGGLALDGASTPLTGGQPERPSLTRPGVRLGLTGVAADGAARLHAGVSRRARFPSLRELYSAALGKFEPNPELGPETLTAAELGVTTYPGSAELQVAVFHHRLTDAMARTTSDLAKYRRVNRDGQRSTGLEIVGGGDIGAISLSGDLTLQRVRTIDPSTPDRLREAEYQPAITGGFEAATTLPWEVRASANLQYMGRQWCVHPDAESDGMRLDPSTSLGGEIGRTFGWRGSGSPSRVETTLALANATDAAVYDQCGLPRPGRTLELRVRVR